MPVSCRPQAASRLLAGGMCRQLNFPSADRAGARGVCDRGGANRLGILVGAATPLAGTDRVGVWVDVVGGGVAMRRRRLVASQLMASQPMSSSVS